MSAPGQVLGLIPARGGSKGIPRKNLRVLAGRPLLAYTADAALESRFLSRVVLSTDDEEIAEVGRTLGLDVPFMRPDALARDTTPTLPVMLHALDALREDPAYDAVCLLQPTCPLRTSSLIDTCIETLWGQEADTVVSIKPVPHLHHPHWVYLKAEDGSLRLASGSTEPPPRRQDLPPAWHRSGAVYVTRTSVLRCQGIYGPRLVGVEDSSPTYANLDTLRDWHRTERHLM
jgi:CMP-N,N'-diacetyllegionaminic acid synthase